MAGPQDRGTAAFLEDATLDLRFRLRGPIEPPASVAVVAIDDESVAGLAGWPPPRAFTVSEVLRTILNEEWEHRLYAERDLAVLTGR